MTKTKIQEIELEKIKEIIPKMLIHKFETIGIQTLGEAMELESSSFEKIKGVGKSSLKEFNDFKSKVSLEPDRVITYYNANALPLSLPLSDYDKEGDILQLFQEIIVDFINLLENQFHKDSIVLYYGLFNNKIRSREDIANLHGFTVERTRQVQISIKNILKNLLSGEQVEKPFCIIPNEISSQFKSFIDKVKENKFITLDGLVNIYLDIYHKRLSNSDYLLLDFLLELYKIEKCKQLESNFTQTELYCSDVSVKKDFLKIAENILRLLKSSIVPQNEMDVIISIRNRIKNADRSLITTALSNLMEIERLAGVSNTYYQVKFEYLTNARDRVFRVLSEKGEEMHIDDLVSEVNQRLVNSNVSKIYNRHSLGLATDKRFTPRQKVGYWQLTEWGQINETLENLTKIALVQLNDQSSFQDIYNKVKEGWPKAKEKSIRTLIGKNCLQLENGNFILPEWKFRFSNLSFKSRKSRRFTKESENKKLLREKVISILNTSSNKSMNSNKIINKITTTHSGLKIPSFYKLFNDEKYFIKKKSGSQLIIQLKTDPIIPRFYVEKYSWTELKKAVTREIQPILSLAKNSIYTKTLDEALNLTYELIIKQTGDFNLDGLEIRLLPTFEKHFLKSSDRSDKIGFLKQLGTGLDPFLKKILFLIDLPAYQRISRNNEGLGTVIKTLIRLDPDKNRYKTSATLITNYRFSEEMYHSYSHRNIDTHNAPDWTEKDIIHSIDCHITIMIFSIFEYFTDIESKI
jgi:hypothetical protein